MLAIAGGKGGVGKTTTALCLAAAHVRRRRRPLVVDADRGMPNCHLYADAPPGGVERVARGAHPERAAAPAARFPGVDVLSGGDADPATYLDRLPRDRPVVVDTAAGAGADVGTALAAADACVVAARADPEALADGLKTAALSRALGTPVVAGALVAADGGADRFERALDAPALAVPPADDPFADPAVAAAHDALLDRAVRDAPAGETTSDSGRARAVERRTPPNERGPNP